MGASSAPEFPFPGGQPGKEPADPVAGKGGHFAWSRWIKEFVKRLDRDTVKRSGDEMTGPLTLRSNQVTTKFSVDSSGLTITGPVTVQAPTRDMHVATKKYVDTRIPPYYQVSMTADATGWATPAGLKAGAVIYSLVDVSNTPTGHPLRLDPATNRIYLGPNMSRTVRIWYG